MEDFIYENGIGGLILIYLLIIYIIFPIILWVYLYCINKSIKNILSRIENIEKYNYESVLALIKSQNSQK